MNFGLPFFFFSCQTDVTDVRLSLLGLDMELATKKSRGGGLDSREQFDDI